MELDIFGNPLPFPKPERYTKNKSGIAQKPYRLKIDSYYHPTLLEGLQKTIYGMPVIEPNLDIPKTVLTTPFDRISHKSVSLNSLVMFYINDYRFIPRLSHPWDYTDSLLKYSGVIGPDLSQYIDMDYPIRLYNNYWNKVFTAYWQKQGLNVYPNVTWSLPDSYEYAVAGLPKGSVITINSMGVHKYYFTKGLWLKGYRYMVDALQPILILRYGPKVKGEYEEISLYLPNDQLNILRNGGKRK